MTKEIVEGWMCSGCGHDIVCKKGKIFDPSFGPPVYGPGGERQYLTVETYSCSYCGALYAPTENGTVGVVKK